MLLMGYPIEIGTKSEREAETMPLVFGDFNYYTRRLLTIRMNESQCVCQPAAHCCNNPHEISPISPF